MVFDKPVTVEVQKKDLRRLYRLAEDMREYDIPYSCPDIDETIDILRKILHMDSFNDYEHVD